MGEKRTTKNSASGVFKLGVISLAFLIIGYEAALFIHKASVLRIEALRDSPDTVFVYRTGEESEFCTAGDDGSVGESRAACGQVAGTVAAEGGRPGSGGRPAGCARSRRTDSVVRRDSPHSPAVEAVRKSTRKVESFRFNPNTVSVGDLVRLGFSEKQAAAIDKYREGGGHFRRKADFAKSFVVSDSVYRRLEPFIDIPRIDINKADSAAFDTLPGIGGWFAARMVSYREELGGYSCKQQLMEIYNFDRQKFDGLSDLIVCSPPSRGFGLWSLPAEELRKHPHIRSWQKAKAIVLYRDNNPRELWTVPALRSAGVLDSLSAARLSLCLIAEP